MRDEILDDEIVFNKPATADNAKAILKLKSDYHELHTKVKHARTATWIMTGIFFLGSIYEGVIYDFDPLVMIFNLVVVVVMAITGFVSFKKPFLGFLLGAVWIALLQILIIIGGSGLEAISGIVPRLVVLYYIIVGMNASKSYIQTLNGLKSFGVTVEGSQFVN